MNDSGASMFTMWPTSGRTVFSAWPISRMSRRATPWRSSISMLADDDVHRTGDLREPLDSRRIEYAVRIVLEPMKA